ncbi:hypothetical protein [Micromonospora sp. RTGN7]|uniref:hypothetical protein n=1 Tax=Micromonospora sp. RTGN7 TaxID=3016526 RepID=UPI0029FF490D|nr:hypothetical protein [Micromonospora sp. RTGN7]
MTRTDTRPCPPAAPASDRAAGAPAPRQVRRAAEELARRLHAHACLPGPSAAPTAWPSDLALVGWLRRLTYAGLYAWAAEENVARRWIGGDIFHTRRVPDMPEFLSGVDLRRLAPHLVAPLLRRLSMTRAAPRGAGLAPAALAADAGRVSTHARTGRERCWGQPEQTPPLPATTVIPHVVHGIWLGRALPAANSFWANYGAAAAHYAGEVDFVLWTDIPRAQFDAARLTPPAPAGRSDPLAGVRDLLTWAEAHGIHLVSVFEVFHARAPMILHTPFALEMGRRSPQAFAAASDHLRVEVIYRFGGLYADGDLLFLPDAEGPPGKGPGGPEREEATSGNGAGYRLFQGRWPGRPDADGPTRLPALFDRVAASPHGFTLHVLTDRVVLNDVVLAPAGHPALALWVEGARYNYLRDQRVVFAAQEPAKPETPAVGEAATWTWAVTPIRTGRVHQWVLARLGISAAELVKPAPAVRGNSDLSWLPPVGGEAPIPCLDPDPLPTLIDCVSLLRWQQLSRGGDLALTAVAPLIRGLPDPDTAWTALLLAFPYLSADLGAVTSVTDRRRNQDKTLDVVVLPPEAEALLDRTAEPDVWFGSDAGTGREFWFLGECSAPARLREAAAR